MVANDKGLNLEFVSNGNSTTGDTSSDFGAVVVPAGSDIQTAADLASLVGKGRKNAGVTVREKKLLGHLTLRGDGHDVAFAAGVHKALGIELPGALQVIVKGETSLQWLGPTAADKQPSRSWRIRRRPGTG